MSENPGSTELEEVRESGDAIYDGRIIKVRKDKVRLPDGSSAEREVVLHAPAVVIAAENADGELMLIEQFRYAVGEVMTELPAGIVEAGEDVEEAASRELQEETGWKPGRLERVAEVYSSPGFCTELFVLFYASELERHSLPKDDDEFIVPRFRSRAEVEEMIARGAVRDAKTLMGLLWWLRRGDASER